VDDTLGFIVQDEANALTTNHSYTFEETCGFV